MMFLGAPPTSVNPLLALPDEAARFVLRVEYTRNPRLWKSMGLWFCADVSSRHVDMLGPDSVPVGFGASPALAYKRYIEAIAERFM